MGRGRKTEGERGEEKGRERERERENGIKVGRKGKEEIKTTKRKRERERLGSASVTLLATLGWLPPKLASGRFSFYQVRNTSGKGSHVRPKQLISQLLLATSFLFFRIHLPVVDRQQKTWAQIKWHISCLRLPLVDCHTTNERSPKRVCIPIRRLGLACVLPLADSLACHRHSYCLYRPAISQYVDSHPSLWMKVQPSEIFIDVDNNRPTDPVARYQRTNSGGGILPAHLVVLECSLLVAADLSAHESRSSNPVAR